MMDFQIKEVLLIAVAVLTIFGIFAGVMAFFWYKISDERKIRASVRESDEYKAVERASSGWKQLYEVTLVQKENLDRELAATRKLLEDSQHERDLMQRRINALMDSQVTMQERIELLERHQLKSSSVGINVSEA